MRSLLRDAQYIVAPRGDTPSSARLYQAAVSGAIPLFVSDDYFKVGVPFPCLVPCTLLALCAREAPMGRSPRETLASIDREVTAGHRKRMRALLNHFAADLLWTHPRSRVAENVLLQAWLTRMHPTQRPSPSPFCERSSPWRQSSLPTGLSQGGCGRRARRGRAENAAARGAAWRNKPSAHKANAVY